MKTSRLLITLLIGCVWTLALSQAPAGRWSEAKANEWYAKLVVDGNIGAKYQDVAEWVETAEPLEAGTVVIVDPSRSNRVLPSRRVTTHG